MGPRSLRPTSCMEQVGPGSRVWRMTVKTEEDGATRNWLYEWDPPVVGLGEANVVAMNLSRM